VLVAFIHILPGWIESTARRAADDREIASLRDNEERLKQRQKGKWKNGDPQEVRATMAVQEKVRQETPRRERLEAERQLYEEATRHIMEARQMICRLAREHNIDSTPLTRLLVLKELDAERDVWLTLSLIADALGPTKPAPNVKRDKDTDAKRKWIYEQAIKGEKTYGQIGCALPKQNKNWDAMTVVGARGAAFQYARDHDLPEPPRRQSPD
jgi:hypothetical protein